MQRHAVATNVIFGALAVLGLAVAILAPLAPLPRTGRLEDIIFVSLINASGYLPLVGAAALLHQFSRRIAVVPGAVIGGCLTASLILWLSWQPLYQEMAGAPLVGFVFIPVWMALMAIPGFIAGCCIGWAIDAFTHRSDAAERATVPFS